MTDAEFKARAIELNNQWMDGVIGDLEYLAFLTAAMMALTTR